MKRAIRSVLPTYLAMVACVLAAACSEPNTAPRNAGRSPAIDTASGAAFSLDGTSWVLARLAGRGAVVGQAPTAEFASGQVRGSDGCNRFTAPFTAKGSTFTVGSGAAMTQMACEPAVMDQAQAFMSALQNARGYRVVDGRLELLSASGEVLATMTAQSTSIVGTWDVVGYNNGREAFVGVLDHVPLDMTFAADNTVSGSAGCNHFNATFEMKGSALHFGPAGATRMACPGEGVMEQEQAFLKAMQTVATIRMEGDTADLRRADGAMALMLRRAPKR
ncbi:MAG: META domain-containing protein [Phycisphaerales bacterium]